MSEKELMLQISSGHNLDVKRIDQLTKSLLRELKNLNLNSVELQKSGKLPIGAKSVDPVTIGGIAVTVISAGLPGLIGFIQSWVLRGNDTHVKVKVGDVELEFTSQRQMTPQEILQLVASLENR
ncbi:MAG: hypothetical protein DHS20C20_28720 [Ardenticatenaceae bacterium]|nr:MAG: hypothetical protein DHS20C20_28720 [Ardenticatenaceae bacterium]